jgi:glutathione synthase/RimK-type ligase-like ATP-grasp enzyme
MPRQDVMGGSIALATAAEAIGLDDDAPVLHAALERCGLRPTLAVWDDDAVDWGGFDLVVLRSTWDYPRRRGAFLRWTIDVAGATRLLNRPDVVAWSSDKRYLDELEARDVAVVPTTILVPGDPVRLPTTGPFVVKPAVSAGSQNTERFTPDDHPAARSLIELLHDGGRDVLVQPYVSEVDDRGETALVYLGGRFSHAIRKGPILAGATETVGGLFAAEQIDPRTPTDAELAAGEAALDAVPFDREELLYGRVDLLPGADGVPLVLEVELVEPSLFLRCDAAAADRFAQLIARAI